MLTGASRIATIYFALLVLLLSASAVSAQSETDSTRYRAAMTKIFLSNYEAIPVFRLNPLSPGDVVQLDNETVYLSHSSCYPLLKPKPLAIQPYDSGTTIGLSAHLKIGADILAKEVAQLDAGVKAAVDDTATITIDPLSITRAADTRGLASVANAPGCDIIPELLSKSLGKYVVTFAVLTGRVRFTITTSLSGQLDVNASGELTKLIARAFSVNEADIRLTGKSANFVLSASPGDLPLALVPASYSLEELARITYFMQGNRGGQLKKLVNAAINAPEPGAFEKIIEEIRDIFGKDEEEATNERWLARFFSGEKMIATDELKERKDVNFDSIGTYGAARELIRH